MMLANTLATFLKAVFFYERKTMPDSTVLVPRQYVLEEIAEKLYDIKTIHRLTNKKLAQLLNISVKEVQNILDAQKMPDLYTAARMQEAFSISIFHLLNLPFPRLGETLIRLNMEREIRCILQFLPNRILQDFYDQIQDWYIETGLKKDNGEDHLRII